MNTKSIDLLHNLLTHPDYVDDARRLNDDSDIMNMLEFILFVLRNHYFSSPDPNVDTNRRARRLMSEIIKPRVMPSSLFMTFTMSRDRNSIGHVSKGEHEGKTVALVSIYRAYPDVRYSPADPLNLFFPFRSKTGSLPTSIDVAISSSPICTTIFGDLSIYSGAVVLRVALYDERYPIPMAGDSSAVAVGGRNACTLPLSAIPLLHTYLFCFLRKLLEVAQGLHYIHSEGVVHGDIRGVFV